MKATLLEQNHCYKDSLACLQQLEGVEAIDFFFAAKLSALYDPLSEHDTAQAFHLLIALSYFQRLGHTCIDVNWLANQHLWTVSEQAPPNKAGFTFDHATVLNNIAQQVAKSTEKLGQACLKYHENRLFSMRYWQFESEVASFINTALTNTIECAYTTSILAVWKNIFGDNNKLLNADSEQIANKASTTDWQKIAIINALNHRFLIINGGPGTGKTYTVARALLLIKAASNNITIKLAAPTGKAAQRLTESIQRELAQINTRPQCSEAVKSLCEQIQASALTLHRLLGIRKFSHEPKYNAQTKLDCDLLLIDEASMIDISMMAKLVRALPAHARLILIGDANQLPAIESGNMLSDMVPQYTNVFSRQQIEHIRHFIDEVDVDQNEHAHTNHIVTLKHVYRSNRSLSVLAEKVLVGNGQEVFNYCQNKASTTIQYHQQLNMKQIVDEAIKHYSPLFLAKTVEQAYQVLQRFRVLAPMKVGEFGTHSLNALIENELVKHIVGLTSASISLNKAYRGKPIMMSYNDYSLGIFNGDVGIIWPDENNVLHAWFDSGALALRKVSLFRISKLESIYAMTVHKTQGSEFDGVLLVLPEEEHELLSKELFYTAITRAKSSLVLVASAQQLKRVINNSAIRLTGLRKKITS